MSGVTGGFLRLQALVRSGWSGLQEDSSRTGSDRRNKRWNSIGNAPEGWDDWRNELTEEPQEPLKTSMRSSWAMYSAGRFRRRAPRSR
jgi:hypothetical protein